ncbi:MAG: hypothetical protein EXX96DRAFT_552314 [Benjaminiella poitrasii]|nr:MAG: hypothetical protein EXX96DRAFT_552314 [Benjaminiella poitrasii]
MVRKRDQIIYKLSDNMQVASISEEQRQQLMKEIQSLHEATMAAAANVQQIHQQQQQQQLPPQPTSMDSINKPIAPKSEALSALDTPPQPTPAEADAIKETARKLREELEQQQQLQLLQQQQQNMNKQAAIRGYELQSSSSSVDGKITRKYHKSGKYSKKRQQLTQQQLIALQQSLQQQPLQPQQQMNINTAMSTPSTSIASSTAASTPLSTNAPSTAFPIQQQQQQQIQDQSNKSSPIPLTPTVAATPVLQKPPQQRIQPPADSILSKRLPEEELQHREIKKRCIESLISDQKHVTAPDYQTPFTSLEDAMNRLLPYHIYQYPKGDLDANKIPLERQDHTIIVIFKCQSELFKYFNTIVKKMEENGEDSSLKILIDRQILMEQRQKLADEQSRVAAEQAAQQQEILRIQAEKARLAAIAEQEAQQQQLLQQQQQLLQQQLLQQQQQQQLNQQQQEQQQQQLNQQQQQEQQQQNPAQQHFQQMFPQQSLEQFLQQQQALQQPTQPQQQTTQQQQQQIENPANYMNGLVQASAILQNPQLMSHYSQLSPELQQRLLRNREQLVALIERQQAINNNSSNNQ